ncbi:hypothetical protein BDW69DRAFT_180121 [Aspergillus filifer]
MVSGIPCYLPSIYRALLIGCGIYLFILVSDYLYCLRKTKERSWAPCVPGKTLLSGRWRGGQDNSTFDRDFADAYNKLSKAGKAFSTTDIAGKDYFIVVPPRHCNEWAGVPRDHLSWGRLMAEEYFLQDLGLDLTWDVRIRTVQACNRGEFLDRVEPFIMKELDKTIGEVFASTKGRWKAFGLLDMTFMLSRHIAVLVVLGPGFNSQRAANMAELLTTFNYQLADRMGSHQHYPLLWKPIVRHLSRKTRRVKSTMQTMKASIVPEIRRRSNARQQQKQPGPDSSTSYLDMMIDLVLKNGIQGAGASASVINDGQVDLMARHVIFWLFEVIGAITPVTATLLLQIMLTPEYAAPLRRELKDALARTEDGKLFRAFRQAPGLESFTKEALRLHTPIKLVGGGYVQKPLHLASQNRTLTPGTKIVLPGRWTHLDAENYPNPTVFDGDRFREGPEGKCDVRGTLMPTPKWLLWGIGTSACPARFLGLRICQALFAKVLLGYDLRIEVQKSQRLFLHSEANMFVNPGVGVFVREAKGDYALNLVFTLEPKREVLNMQVTYDPDILSHDGVQRMAFQFEHVLRQLHQEPAAALGEVQVISPQDMNLLQRWNSSIPQADSRCLDELVAVQTAVRPTAMAISSWDGDMTYQELMSRSLGLALHLRDLKVRRRTRIATVLNKSKWTLVAILGILRAGGTCIMLDSEYPRQRMQNIIYDASVSILITSADLSAQVQGLCGTKMLLCPEMTQIISEDLLHGHTTSVVNIDPEDPAFILFTSGSTGKPKGIIMAHRTLVSSIRSHGSALQVTSDTRALHWASYTFDISIYEIFTTWAAGGCVCIPSEFERKNDLAEAVRRLGANWAFLTPSVSQTIDPSEVPLLTTLVLGGEAVTLDHIAPWKGRSLVNGYGPAEATVCAVGSISGERSWRSGRIGHVIGGLEATASSFIGPPCWRRHMSVESPSRLYRTGDLVQYQDDGSIRFIGRKDTQVKLRGQRIDLGEVQCNLLSLWPTPTEVVAEVVMLAVPEDTATLVAFVVDGGPLHASEEINSTTVSDILLPASSRFRDLAASVQARLRTLLPSYMVPSIFIPLSHMPYTMTGKTNRRLLHSALQSIRPAQLQMYRSVTRKKSPVTNPVTRRLRDIWSEVLRIPAEDIGAEDSFLYLGADSVAALKMCAIARRSLFHFTLADVMEGVSLSDLAQQAPLPSQTQHPQESNELAPRVFQVQGIERRVQSILEQFRLQGTLSAHGEIVAISSLTAAQLALTQHYPWTHFQFSFHGKLCEETLRESCRRLIGLHSILRTVFVEVEGQAMQIVLESINIDIHIHSMQANDQTLTSRCALLCAAEQDEPVFSAGLPTRFSVVTDSISQDHTLILRLAHAQYDGFCIPNLIADLEAIYNGRASSLKPTHFVENYLPRLDQAAHGPEACAFWREYLHGSTMAMPLALTDSDSDSPQDQDPDQDPASRTTTASTALHVPRLPQPITLATLVKASLALSLFQESGNNDLVFGHTVAGRATPFSSSEGTNLDLDLDPTTLVGPCPNYAPYRISIDPSATVAEYLNYAQAQYTRTMAYESTSLPYIVHSATDWPAETHFGFIVQHQQVASELSLKLGSLASESFRTTGRLIPGETVWVCSTPTEGSAVTIDVIADRERLGVREARRLVGCIRDAMIVLADEDMRDESLGCVFPALAGVEG